MRYCIFIEKLQKIA